MLTHTIIRAHATRVCAVHHRSSTIMPLVAVSEPPRVAAADEPDAYESTPKSLEEIPSRLVLHVDPVHLCMRPVPPFLQERDIDTLASVGTLWLTEQRFTFLPRQGKGFQVDYPSIALHAVSRSVPEYATHDDFGTEMCLYCQLDDHPERDEEEEDEVVREMWILTHDAASRTCHSLTI